MGAARMRPTSAPKRMSGQRREELANVTGTRHYSRAVFKPGCYLMLPATLVRSLADSLPPNIELL